MKKILLEFYSCRNLGDDLFVKIFSDYFRDCHINLIVNLRYIPKDLRKNVKIHPFSLVHTVVGKIQSILGWDSKISEDIHGKPISYRDSCENAAGGRDEGGPDLPAKMQQLRQTSPGTPGLPGPI